ncbi:MAG: hypothetical protein ACLFM1_11245, partial [Bacteroidales bacterium]
TKSHRVNNPSQYAGLKPIYSFFLLAQKPLQNNPTTAYNNLKTSHTKSHTCLPVHQPRLAGRIEHLSVSINHFEKASAAITKDFSITNVEIY